MDIRDLEVFLAVAERLNFTRAGEKVHLSQPSVSVRVRKLEEELGVKLFEQLGRKVVLTEAGRLLEPYARQVVMALSDAEQAIAEFRGLERGSLRIGASTTPGMYIVPRVLGQFKRRYPKIQIRLSIMNTRQIEEGVANNDFDLGFVGGHLVGDNVQAIPWLVDEIVLVVRPDHPFARKRSVEAAALRDENFIVRESGSATRAVIQRGLREVNLDLKVAAELGNPEAIKEAVRNGLGLAFVSKFAVQRELAAGALTAVRVKGLELKRQLNIVYHKDRHLPQIVTALIEMARRLNWPNAPSDLQTRRASPGRSR